MFDAKSRVLMLGTMPSPKSREQGFYYGHPQNRFWKVLAAAFDAEVPQTIPEKKQLLLTHHIALWDVLASCTIAGASDASIRDPQAQRYRPALRSGTHRADLLHGAKATQLYRKLCEPAVHLPCEQLPSTSPANAAMKLPDLVEAYRAALLPFLG